MATRRSNVRRRLSAAARHHSRRIARSHPAYHDLSRARTPAEYRAAMVKHGMIKPPVAPPPPKPGMTSGEKVVLVGIGAVAVLGIFLLARNASASSSSSSSTTGPTGPQGPAGPA